MCVRTNNHLCNGKSINEKSEGASKGASSGRGLFTLKPLAITKFTIFYEEKGRETRYYISV